MKECYETVFVREIQAPLHNSLRNCGNFCRFGSLPFRCLSLGEVVHWTYFSSVVERRIRHISTRIYVVAYSIKLDVCRLAVFIHVWSETSWPSARGTSEPCRRSGIFQKMVAILHTYRFSSSGKSLSGQVSHCPTCPACLSLSIDGTDGTLGTGASRTHLPTVDLGTPVISAMRLTEYLCE